MRSFVQINPADDVAVAIRPLAKGEELEVGTLHVVLAEDIPQGHKFALRRIAQDEPIHKYGLVIGHATLDIEAGSWIHTHNMKTNLSGELSYTYEPTTPEIAPVAPETFMGYRRDDGRAAIRNEIWIIPTVGCVNEIAKDIAERANNELVGSVERVVSFSHPFGCSQTGADHEQTKKLLVALSRHPNACGVLFLSLGCENCTHEQILEELGPYDSAHVKFLRCQDVDDELAAGEALVHELMEAAGNYTREPIPASELVIGLKCGGSDGLSGITANPTIGAVSDMAIARGASTVLTEVPEMFGAEAMLLNRCASREVFNDATAMLNGFKDYFLRHGEVVYENPSPGNKQGGITTLEDKSCGCVQKGGTAPIVDIVPYASQVAKKGLSLLCSPGNDMVSTTALTAAGCHMILFSTGRGTPFSAPAPTVKVYTNTALANKKPGWMDFNAGRIADGTLTRDEAATELWHKVLAVASGELTAAERRGWREISIWKDGVVM